jgi:hypothetical protein
MSQALIWVELDNTNGSTITTPQLPGLDFGLIEDGIYSSKKIIQLQWLNSSVECVKLWLDTTIGDIYGAANPTNPTLRSDLYQLGYRFKYCLLDTVDPIVLPNAVTSTTTNISGFASDILDNAPDTHDGVVLNSGDNLLVKSQTTKTQNGLYFVDSVSSTSSLYYKLDTQANVIFRGRIATIDNAACPDVGKSYFMYASGGEPGTTATYDAGLSIKWVERTTRRALSSCAVASTNNISDFTNAPDILDGYTLNLNDRILVRKQTTALQNGVYYVSSLYPVNQNAVNKDSQWNNIDFLLRSNTDNRQIGIYSLNGTINKGKVFRYYHGATLSNTNLQWTDATHYFGTTTVKVATSSNISFSAAPNVVNGITLVNGDLVLVKNQTATYQNGVYSVTSAGTGSNGIWARSTSFDTTNELLSTIVFLQNGTNSYGGNFYYMTRGIQNNLFSLNSVTNGAIVVEDRLNTPYIYRPCTNLTDINVNIAGEIPETQFRKAPINSEAILVTGQTNPIENGIYFSTLSSFTYQFTPASGYSQIIRGAKVTLTAGTQPATWMLYAPGASVALGSANVTFFNYSTFTNISAKYFTTENLSGYSAGSFPTITANINGVLASSLLNNDKIVVKSQTIPSQNGIYFVNGVPVPFESTISNNTTYASNINTVNLDARYSHISVETMKGTNHGEIYIPSYKFQSNYLSYDFTQTWKEQTSTWTKFTTTYYFTGNPVSGTAIITDGFGISRALVSGDTILVDYDTDKTKNGIYQIGSANSWSRHSSFDTTTELIKPTLIRIQVLPSGYAHFYMQAETTPAGYTTANTFVLGTHNINVYSSLSDAGGTSSAINGIDTLQTCQWVITLGYQESLYESGTSNVLTTKLTGNGTPTVGQRVLVNYGYPQPYYDYPTPDGSPETGIWSIASVGSGIITLQRVGAENYTRFGCRVRAPYIGSKYTPGNTVVTLTPTVSYYLLDQDSGSFNFIPASYHVTQTVAVRYNTSVASLTSMPMVVDSYNLANFDSILLTANLASNVPGNGIYDFAISKYSYTLTRDSTYQSVGISPLYVSTSLPSAKTFRSYYDPTSTTLGTSSIEFLDESLLTDFTARLATNGSAQNINLASPPNFIDGTFLAANDVILVKNQVTNPSQNGIYLYKATNNFTLARSPEFDNDNELFAYGKVSVSDGSTLNEVYELHLPPATSYTFNTVDKYFRRVSSLKYYYQTNAVTSTNISNLTNAVPDTIDGVDLTLSVSNRVLLRGQTTAADRYLGTFVRAAKKPIYSRVTTGNATADQFSIEPLTVSVLNSATGLNTVWESYFDSASTAVGSSNVYFMNSNTWSSNFPNADTISVGSNIDLSALASGTLNGVALADGITVIVKDQTSATQNGLYTLGYSRSVKLVRHSKMNSTSELNPYLRVNVNGGIVDGNSWYGIWLSSSSPVLNSTNIYWAKQPNTVRFNDCRLATTTNIATLYGGAPLTVDGTEVLAGDRILVKNQSTSSANGIYSVEFAGTGSDGRWVRATDFNENTEIFPGAVTKVITGIASENKDYLISLPQPVSTIPYYTIGSTNIAWNLADGLAVYNSDPSTWNDLPTLSTTAISLGRSNLSKNNIAKSTKIGLAVYVPSGQNPSLIRNMRFVTQFKPYDGKNPSANCESAVVETPQDTTIVSNEQLIYLNFVSGPTNLIQPTGIVLKNSAGDTVSNLSVNNINTYDAFDVDSNGKIWEVSSNRNLRQRSYDKANNAWILETNITITNEINISSLNTNSIPTSIALDSSNNKYVVYKTFVSSVFVYNINKLNSTNTVTTWINEYNTNVLMYNVTSICIDINNNIYIAENNNKIIKFNNSGVYVTHFTCTNAQSVSVDISGNIYVTTTNGLLRKYNSSGLLQSEAIVMSSPNAICINKAGEIFIAGNDSSKLLSQVEVYNTSLSSLRIFNYPINETDADTLAIAVYPSVLH